MATMAPSITATSISGRGGAGFTGIAEDHGERASFADLAADAQETVLLSHGLMSDRKTEAGDRGFGREERIEDVVDQLLLDAASAVVDTDLDRFRSGRSTWQRMRMAEAPHRDRHRAAVGHGFARIGDEVRRHPFYKRTITQEADSRGFDFGPHLIVRSKRGLSLPDEARQPLLSVDCDERYRWRPGQAEDLL